MALVVDQVSKRFRSSSDAALDKVDLEIRSGEVVALVGSNGAGKTTLARSIAGALVVDSGTIEVFGHQVGSSSAMKRFVGYVPQELGVYQTQTVGENLEFMFRLWSVPKAQRPARLEVLLDTFLLGDLADRVADSLSGGERRRLHAAMGLVHEPPVVLLDEPTAGVDVTTRQRLLAAVRAMADDGRSVLYTTHYMDEVHQVADRVVLLDRGRVTVEGTPDDITRRLGSTVVRVEFDGLLTELGPGWTVEDGVATRHGVASGDWLTEVASAVAASEGAVVTRVTVDQPRLDALFSQNDDAGVGG